MGTRTNFLIWAALCVSQVIYVVVAIRKPPSPDPMDVSTNMFPALLLVAASIAVGTLWWRRRALAGPIQSGELDLATPDGQRRGFTALILNMVLSQAIAIYGLVLTFISSEIFYTLGFVAAGLALMFVHRPFASDLQSPTRTSGLDLGPPPIQ